MSDGGMNGQGFTGGPVQLPAGQLRPGAQVSDHRDADGVASPAANTRITAITGIILGVIPVLSVIGLIVSIVALFGYRRAAAKPTLAVIGIVISALVLAGSTFYLFSALVQF